MNHPVVDTQALEACQLRGRSAADLDLNGKGFHKIRKSSRLDAYYLRMRFTV
jgi:hypothetical protein